MSSRKGQTFLSKHLTFLEIHTERILQAQIYALRFPCVAGESACFCKLGVAKYLLERLAGTEQGQNIRDVGGIDFLRRIRAGALDTQLERAKIAQLHNFTIGEMLRQYLEQGFQHGKSVDCTHG